NHECLNGGSASAADDLEADGAGAGAAAVDFDDLGGMPAGGAAVNSDVVADSRQSAGRADRLQPVADVEFDRVAVAGIGQGGAEGAGASVGGRRDREHGRRFANFQPLQIRSEKERSRLGSS